MARNADQSRAAADHGSAQRILFELQVEQHEHDEKYHREIARLSMHQRLNHMALHFAKYTGKIAASNDPSPIVLEAGMPLFLIWYALLDNDASEMIKGESTGNPSTADAELDDPTIRRCIRFARDGNYGGIEVGNLFAWRATDAAELRQIPEPIGPNNDSMLGQLIATAPMIVCAWGNKGTLLGRNQQVLDMIYDAGKKPHCLKMTGLGHPSHPLYLSAQLRPSLIKNHRLLPDAEVAEDDV